MFKKKHQESSIWNKKAKQYGRFSHDTASFQHHILSKIAQRGITFHGKTILDIGCGTGIYTLHLAQNALHVKALDVSEEMLNILHEDAIHEGLATKFSFTCNPWDTFESSTRYDIVFSSMSPALQHDADFAKMHAYAKEYCVYLGWGGKRESTLLDPIFKAHGHTLPVPSGGEKLRAWLDGEAIVYTQEYIEEKRLHVKPYEQALESVLWHFEINNHTPNVELIQNILSQMQDENTMVSFETITRVELISWEK